MPNPSDWFKSGYDNLRAAKLALDFQDAMIGIGLYHCQQAAKKALKAYLCFKSYKIPKSDISDLLELCIGFDADFMSIQQDISSLAPLANKTRCPDDFYILPDLTTANILYKKAEAIYSFVENKVYSIKQ